MQEKENGGVTIPWLGQGDPFPPAESALCDPDGLLAAGGGLSSDRLVTAYARGIFPWFSEHDPVLWWSPDPRAVLGVQDMHVSRSLRRTLRSSGYRVTADTAFSSVVQACAAPRDVDGGTWITNAMAEAYGRLAVLGHAHSVEVWSGGTLVGGLYGVALGRMFYGESMFSRQPDASKVALVCLARQLEAWGFELIDCQVASAHLVSLGARTIPRTVFLRAIDRLTRLPPVPSPWALAQDLPETVRVR
ncbi:MAG: leucyl/phenylalanyl-tRNA--protein transferase [Acidobacteria bacterium]|nr:leucyl/phenylalanyl-tRNA--protein transferase [Acidobacteriota bacterium]